MPTRVCPAFFAVQLGEARQLLSGCSPGSAPCTFPAPALQLAEAQQLAAYSAGELAGLVQQLAEAQGERGEAAAKLAELREEVARLRSGGHACVPLPPAALAPLPPRAAGGSAPKAGLADVWGGGCLFGVWGGGCTWIAWGSSPCRAEPLPNARRCLVACPGMLTENPRLRRNPT